MSIEENEDIADTAVRGWLGTAFAAAEPPLRDLASGSIARGDAARHRNRMLAAGGAALSVVAVIGTFAVVTGTTPAKHDDQNPAHQVTSAASTASTASPKGPLGFGPDAGGVEKVLDIRQRLPELLKPLLPNGIAVGQTPSGANLPEALTNVLLGGPSGTNKATMWVGSAPTSEDMIRQTACPSKGSSCQTRTVDGGTVYLDEMTGTEAGLIPGSGLPADILKPGTEKNRVTKTLSMTFVPTDRTKYAFNFTVYTATARVQYANKAPEDYVKNDYGAWPPNLLNTLPAYDPAGLLVSADDLVAMLAKPGLDKVESLLDPRTAISPDTQAEIAATKSQIAAAAGPALPSGVKVSVDDSMLQSMMMVTGPTGKNQLSLGAEAQSTQYRQQTLGFCPPTTTCTKRAVPGGTLLVWADKPTDSKLTVLSNTPSGYNYWFFPDDTSKPALTMTLETSAAQTGSPGKSEPDPGGTSSVSDGPYAPAQVSADQFLTAAENGSLATAISKTTALLATLQ